VLTISCKKNVAENKQCIEYIIAKDDSLGKIRNHACKEQSLSKTIHQYIGALNALDTKDCAPAFNQAFNNHKKAWLNTLKVTDNYSHLRGEMHDLFAVIETSKDSTEFKILINNIWSTWAEVEKAIK
jgi:hypothetical protein